MKNFDESSLKELTGLYTREYSERNTAGSPQRLIRKGLYILNGARSLGLIPPAHKEETNLEKIKTLAHAITKIFPSRIEVIAESGAKSAIGKFNLMEEKLISAEIPIIFAMVATASWLESRKDAIDWRQGEEEKNRILARIKKLEAKIQKHQTNMSTLQAEIQTLTSKLPEN